MLLVEPKDKVHHLWLVAEAGTSRLRALLYENELIRDKHGGFVHRYIEAFTDVGPELQALKSRARYARAAAAARPGQMEVPEQSRKAYDSLVQALQDLTSLEYVVELCEQDYQSARKTNGGTPCGVPLEGGWKELQRLHRNLQTPKLGDKTKGVVGWQSLPFTHVKIKKD
jgi:hypothetical protein